VQVECAYDVSPPTLLDVLTDPTFLAARGERYGGIGAPKIERTSTTIVVTTTRQLPLDRVPAPFRRFVGNGQAVQVDTWSITDGPGVVGTWTLDTGAAPIDLHGSYTIVDEPPGCRYAVEADVRVHIPVLARRLERQVAEHLADLVRAEQAFAADWRTGMMDGREGSEHG
jgi:hypothetical protein